MSHSTWMKQRINHWSSLVGVIATSKEVVVMRRGEEEMRGEFQWGLVGNSLQEMRHKEADYDHYQREQVLKHHSHYFPSGVLHPLHQKSIKLQQP